MSLRFIHTGDLHCNKERTPTVLKVLDKIKQEASKVVDEKPYIDAICFCGDFWDSTITNTDASGFTQILDAMYDLHEGFNDIYMIYGTPSHENAGSLRVFEKMGVKVLSADTPYKPSVHVIDGDEPYEIVAIPEPRISLVEGKTLEEKYSAIQKSYRDLTLVPKTTEHRIVMFHGLVAGALLDNCMGVPKGETAIDKTILDSLEADVIMCAHIHRKQKVEGMSTPCFYCGSIPPKNFGETHESSFNIIEV